MAVCVVPSVSVTDAVMVTAPAFLAVTTPEELTVATLLLFVDQVTVCPLGLVVAVSVTVPPSATEALVELSVITGSYVITAYGRKEELEHSEE